MSDRSKAQKPQFQEQEQQQQQQQEATLPNKPSSQYQFANNPAMNRAWLRNLLFGFAIAMPLSLYGLGMELWQTKNLVEIYGIVVVTSMVLLPIYSAIVRELP